MALSVSRRAARDVEPGMQGLWFGVLVFRWASYAWMTALAILTREDLRAPGVAFGSIVVIGVWSLWFSVTRGWQRPLVLWIDLTLAAALLLVSGLVMQEGTAGEGAPFFATSYPATAALSVGAAVGIGGGIAAGVLLSLALVISRPLNGLPLVDLTPDQWASLVNGAVYYLTAGGAAGAVSRVLARSAAERTQAIEDAARERERAARLAEREALGREIHDSVLQSLALVAKRGTEMTSRPSVPAGEVRELVELSARQEQELRALLNEPHGEPPPGTVPLRTALQAAAFGVDTVPVTVSTADPAWIPASDVGELTGAVHQALENAAEHASATKVLIFAEQADGEVVITIRDDGAGFVYDEGALERQGKMGMLRSMKGRIEGIGGTMLVHSAPGAGTEVEFRLPVQVGLG